MRRKARLFAPDLREDWQVAQGQQCPCHGFDDMCVCQNADEPWKYGLGGTPPPTELQIAQTRIRELEGHVRTLELQQQTDRQTIAAMSAAARHLHEALAEVEVALNEHAHAGWRTQALARIRAALAKAPAP